MADEPQTPTPAPAGDSAPAAPAAPAPVPGESIADAPGFQKESFSDVLERVSSAKDPAKAAPTDDTPEPEESKEKVETKAEPKADLPPEAPQPEEDEDGDDLALLSAEEINSKFSNAPKGLRTYAAKIVEKFEPIAQIVDELGGVEAIKRLDKIQTIALGAPDLKEGGNVDQLHDQLKSLNPEMAVAYNSKCFYSVLDDPVDGPVHLNAYIQADDRYKDYTVEKLKQLADLEIDGHIDLAEIQEKIDADDPKAAERRVAAEAKEQADAAKNKERDDRLKAMEERDQQSATEQEIIRIRGIYEEKTGTVLKKFGLGKDFIKADDPDDIKQVKEAYQGDIEAAVGRRMAALPIVQDLAKRIGQKDKGDGYAWLVEKCANAYKGIVREEVMKRNGLLAGYLKSYGKEVKETRRPEPDVDAATAARAKTTKTEEGAPQEKPPLSAYIEKHAAASKVA